ncbi:hypothetical protein Taro_042724 [Colocasia esculenta]|uniref:non-specific serine/threonine protein kinase n=1 Tax=Colocasia esculenta TaxID=4460 RepID=A0A843X044_COLES|nr:hypothetical protein [Colocasia esculenta]
MAIPSSNRGRLPFPLSSSFLLFSSLFLLAGRTTAQNSSFAVRDYILLNCGASGQLPDENNRNWTGDIGSTFAPSSQNTQIARAAAQDSSVSQVPYLTARVFTSPFTYSFPVSPGHKFVRLYFYPANYSTYFPSDSRFAVTANPGNFTLLSNFSASQTAQALNFAYLIREFSVNVSSGSLNLTFTPTAGVPKAYAFVNGIEIVSMPNLFGAETLTIVGQSTTYPVDETTALQTMYRLNVGGNAISPVEDIDLFRSWADDSPYIFSAATGVTYGQDSNVSIRYSPGVPEYAAPTVVYGTARSMGNNANINIGYNLTWLFSVDPGFFYLVRMHFCEIQYPFTKINQRVFSIYLNNQTATQDADVIAFSGAIGSPVYRDYIVLAPDGADQQDFWVALHPYQGTKPEYYDAILNGLEIFKLSSQNGNLAGPNPIPLPEPTPDPTKVVLTRRQKSKSKTAVIAGAVGGVAAAILLVWALVFLVCRRGRKVGGREAGSSDGPSGWLPLSLIGNSHSAGSAKTNTTGSYASSLPSNLCRHFSFAEIKAATNGFDESLLLGVGGFGKVYRGEIDGGTTKVAIKRGNPMSEQGVHEFQTEIEMLSKLRHRHLVSLIGYCEENREMILVYDYMAHGTLREHLYKTQKPPLPWKQRLEICIGAARGLHYLHTGAKHTIIHRDVKTTNILLDEKWVAKVSDFGLSKTGPTLDHTHVSTVVKGSFGYLDPEYFRRQQLTEKSDVYSFGVVLFEVLCARPALNPQLAKEEVSLAEWALHCQKKGVLDQIIDPYLKGKIAPQCFKKFAETAEKCVADNGIDRPAMGDVLWNLEFALQLQESAEESGSALCGMSDSSEGPPILGGKKGHTDPSLDSTGMTSTSTTSISIGGRSIASEDSDGLTPSAVFSQIMNPKGR